MADRRHNTRPTDAELAEAFRDLEPMICRLAGLASVMNIVVDNAMHFRCVGEESVTLTMGVDQEDALMVATTEVISAAHDLRQHWNSIAEGRTHG